jgi:signal peptidase I
MNDTFSLNPEGYKISSQRARAILKAVLESGKNIELTAAGYSMFPTLRPGDKITVKPLLDEEFQLPGRILVYENNGVFVMHRLIKIITDGSGKKLFFSRGDSSTMPDEPWVRQQLIGIAVSFKRNNKVNPIKNFIPGSWRYVFNRRLLWIINKGKRLTIVAGDLLNGKP